MSKLPKDWFCEAFVSKIDLKPLLKSNSFLSQSQEFRKKVRKKCNEDWSKGPTTKWKLKEDDIVRSIERFSDRVICHNGQPMKFTWDTIKSRVITTIGGVRTDAPNFGIDDTYLLLPTQLMGAIGEGIAGNWLESHYQMDIWSRPVGIGLDGIFKTKTGSDLMVLEVKSAASTSSTGAKERAIYASEKLLQKFEGLVNKAKAVGGKEPMLALSIGVSICAKVRVYCIEFKS